MKSIRKKIREANRDVMGLCYDTSQHSMWMTSSEVRLLLKGTQGRLESQKDCGLCSELNENTLENCEHTVKRSDLIFSRIPLAT